MNELMKVFGQVGAAAQSFDEIRISIASPERILSWSYGEGPCARGARFAG